MSTKTMKPPPAILQKSALALERFHSSTLIPASITNVMKNGQGLVMNKRNHSVKDDTSAASLMLPELSSGGFTRENTEEPAQLLTQQIDVQKALKKNKKIKLKPMQSADDVSRISSSPKKGGNNSTQILDGSSVTSVNAQSIDAIDVSKASTMPPSGRGQRGGIVVIDHRSEKEKEQKVEAVKEMIEKSKAVGGSVTRKMFKLPIKLVNECKDSSSN